MQNRKRAGRAVVFLATMMLLLLAQSTVAAERSPGDGGRRFVEQAKRLIVAVLSRFGTPPGSPLPPP